MAESFEELQVWQDSRDLVTGIYSITSKGALKNDRGFREQIQRAALSIMSNIAEGFERSSNKEFIRFLDFAKGSSGEVRAQLYAALDLKYLTEKEFEDLSKKCVNISKQLTGFMSYLKTKL